MKQTLHIILEDVEFFDTLDAEKSRRPCQENGRRGLFLENHRKVELAGTGL